MISSVDTDNVIQRAQALSNAGQIAQAIDLVRSAIEDRQNDGKLWHMLGILHRTDQDSAAALVALEKALTYQSENPVLHHAVARVSMEAGLPAVDKFDKARSFAPNDGSIILGRSAAQLAAGQFDEAIADLELILASNPLWLEGHELLSEARWSSGDKDGLTKSFVKALKTNQKNGSLWAKCLDALFKADRFADAAEMVGEARKALGDSRGLMMYDAICASELGETEKANRLFASLAPITEIALAVRHMRHLLRTGQIDLAARLGESFIQDSEAHQIWPYLSLAWRALDDPRWKWLDDQDGLVQIYDLQDQIDLAGLAQCLRSIHVAKEDMVGQSVRGGTQTDGPLFARIDPEIRKLRSVIQSTVRTHVAGLPAVDPSHPVLRHRSDSISFSGSWSVRLTGKGFHTSHLHPMGWFSSAFYVNLPDEANMGPPPAGWLALGAPPPELNLDLSSVRRIEPKPGRLVIFPSIMWHGTIPFDEGERLSVAFDIATPPTPGHTV
ncbi:2OG-Fe(II) oxygenase family protein [Parasphingorhabdus sp.]|uniref:2OG-Fe(II) oxygenase family protein n=1 Tax=Parasphingorhabdus sp. TaxID=2709688 RepID=UPI002B27B7E1|nr:putative 2OG-Fe(II) oxygenase [Parasphingorhabdus sp.]